MYGKTYINKFIIFLVLISPSLFSQIIDSCGIDDSPILNKYESEFLNYYFKDKGDTFNFINKKLVFITGSNGSKISNKVEYFNSIRKWQNDSNSKIVTTVFQFTPEQKEESGGYDAIVTFWVKILLPSRKQEIIYKLKAGN